VKYLSDILAIPLFTFVVSFFLCKFIIYFSHKYGQLDHPNEFRQHDTPTPYFGGIAIFASISIGFILLTFSTGLLFFTALAIAFSFFFIAGLIDDIYKLSSIPKLIIIIAASIISPIFLTTSIFNYLIIVYALIFFTNSFNLLDNIDGLCASTALSIFFALIIYRHYAFPLTAPIMIAVFAVSGFLILNLPKAKIFMGDTGSLLIGALCVIFTFLSLEHRNILNIKTFSFLPLFWLPLYDTFSVIIVRLAAGKSVLIGGKDHFSHRLMKRGMSNWSVIAVLFFITLIAGTVSLFLQPVFSVAIFIFLIAASASYELLTCQK